MRIKADVEIVTGFLGSGKTSFINTLIDNTLVDGEKILVILCERGEQDIIRSNSQIIIKDFNPQDVGSRGLNSLQEMVLGSVSHKIAKRVQCPVLIVK